MLWQVTDSYIPSLNDKTEWNGTSVAWDIVTSGDAATITMIHRGLKPQVECFEMCDAGWNRHIGNSLRQFLTEGQGTPS